MPGGNKKNLILNPRTNTSEAYDEDGFKKVVPWLLSIPQNAPKGVIVDDEIFWLRASFYKKRDCFSVEFYDYYSDTTLEDLLETSSQCVVQVEIDSYATGEGVLRHEVYIEPGERGIDFLYKVRDALLLFAEGRV